ncbi:uncharacterized protein PGTG_05197 [Puccinia graminis f. sp. tritici CRL 75-36-700-3]|uniref:Major facilitator superfamily (MFS) profile domain-containing protein n=1 Tax=Puccinia graminis f. sp. tritici (strain CRL 75-36-700-3 / race SCCL) TaxID=418459 RepID=E3K729_PUCGT|nr:uncharacterized protein PGTG_05197 [Puccinia graminis f. sp. tritici CRL 75-36-700-3]EFP79972.2 hypothetical protein PGTG_05197 [Puccinia graminis f. sp. tritici CRL 75-36-700-3]
MAAATRMWKSFQANHSFHLVATLTGLSFALMGYENGLFGGLTDNPQWKQRFGYPSRLSMSTIVAIYQIGCLTGSMVTSVCGEALGRKMTIRLGAIWMSGGALLQTLSLSSETLIIGRILSGIGMGFISSTAPVLLAEVSPSAKRGKYACAQLSTLNLGICLSYWMNYGTMMRLTGSATFQLPIAFQYSMIIPIAALTCMVPESPLWLMFHNQASKALDVLTSLEGAQPNEAVIRGKFLEMEANVIYENSIEDIGYKVLFQNDGLRTRERMLIACSVQSFQQLGGVNAIVYHAHFLFSSCLGFSEKASSLISALLFTWFFMASFVPWFLIDTLGRRILMIPSVAIMGSIFAALAGITKQIEENTQDSDRYRIAAAVLSFIFLAVFSIGFQATVWFYPPEILPQRVRAQGTAIATACNWALNWTNLLGYFSGWKTYLIFMALNILFVPIMFFYFPETKGKTLEEIDLMFGDTVSAERRRCTLHKIQHSLRGIDTLGEHGKSILDYKVRNVQTDAEKSDRGNVDATAIYLSHKKGTISVS